MPKNLPTIPHSDKQRIIVVGLALLLTVSAIWLSLLVINQPNSQPSTPDQQATRQATAVYAQGEVAASGKVTAIDASRQQITLDGTIDGQPASQIIQTDATGLIVFQKTYGDQASTTAYRLDQIKVGDDLIVYTKTTVDPRQPIKAQAISVFVKQDPSFSSQGGRRGFASGVESP